MDTMQPRRQAFEPIRTGYGQNNMVDTLAREFKRIQQKVLRRGKSAKVSAKPLKH